MTNFRFPVLILVILIFFFFTSHNSSGIQALVALYHDEGVWVNGLHATKYMLDWMEIDWQEIDSKKLTEQELKGFEIFWLAGGWAPDYERKIHQSGRRAILNFVKNGGVYVGICAGAYYAATRVVWEGTSYPYRLKLFHGRAVGPEIYPWPTYGLAALTMVPQHPINAQGSSESSMLLYGGGYFMPASKQDISVVATYKRTERPAIVTFTYGDGKVLLLGVHPEIEEDSKRDGIGFAEWLDDEGSDWPFMKAAVDWLLNG